MGCVSRMEPIATRRNSRSSSYEKLVLVGFGLLAVISPLYINRTPVTDPEVDEESVILSCWLPLLLILAIGLSLFIGKSFTRYHTKLRGCSDKIIFIIFNYSRGSRFSSYEKLVGLGLGLLAVISPLYINRRPDCDLELEEQTIDFTVWLPLLLLVLILAIALSLYLDQSLTKFDVYWIHRVGGSSGGIIVILVVLALVLKCKAFNGGKRERSW